MKTIALVTMCFLPGTFLAVSPSPSPSHSALERMLLKPPAAMIGSLCHAVFQLGWRRPSICEAGIQVLLGHCYSFDGFGAGAVGACSAVAVEAVVVGDDDAFEAGGS
jgi:hypothetical protein